MSAGESNGKQVPIREGLLSVPLSDLAKVRLMGSRCRSCGEVTLGRNSTCPNCGGTEVEAITLGDRGSLWTYTVVRHKPPGDYRGPDPFKPFCIGLVELPEGLRVMSPIEGDVESMQIGMPLSLRTFIHHKGDAGEDVVAFAFAPAAA